MIKNLIAYFLIILMYGCNQGSKIDQTKVIFDRIEKIIIENSESKFDTIKTISSDKFVEKIFLKGNRILKKELYSVDTSVLSVITRYSADGKFELRNEISKSGAITTNGIVFEGKYYGPWEVNYDNGQEMYRGFRYEDSHFGDEDFFNEKGRIEITRLRGNEQYFDSLIIKFGHFLKKGRF